MNFPNQDANQADNRHDLTYRIKIIYNRLYFTLLVTHELKVISSNKTRYKPGCEDRAVDKRAEALPQEYLVKAREADHKYNGVLPGAKRSGAEAGGPGGGQRSRRRILRRGFRGHTAASRPPGHLLGQGGRSG